jgi:5-methyltetrahydropteroyltriglutamate--homocysteine methyltransferase
MMANRKPPYRAEHVGSLPRPDRLMEAREKAAAGALSREELRRIEDECIRDAVAMQERVGIGAITDGEYRKRGWREFLYDKCHGFGPETVERGFPIRMFDGTTLSMVREPKVTARLGRREPLSADDFSALEPMTRRPIKANLPISSPGTSSSIARSTPTASGSSATSRASCARRSPISPHAAARICRWTRCRSR